MFLRQHDFGDGAAVHCEGLEELRSVPHRLWVLHDDPHGAAARAVSDLYPVPAQAWREDGW